MSVKEMKRGGYRIDVQLKGRRIRETVYCTYEEALRREEEIKRSLKAEVDVTREDKYKLTTMRELFELAIEHRWRNCKCDSGIRRARMIIEEFIGWDTPAIKVDSNLVAQLSTHYRVKGNSEATINRKKCALSTLLSVGRQLGRIPSTHKPHLGLAKEKKGRLRWLNEAEEKRLLSAAFRCYGHEYRFFIEFLIDTGARLSEALQAHVNDINNGRITFWHTKSGEPRTIPLTDRIKGKLPSEGYLFPSFANRDTRHLYTKLEETLKAAKLGDDVVYHTMRHTCATRLVQAGVDVRVIKEWLGHSTITTTMRYAHLAPKLLDSALEKLQKTA
jgi:integrase